MKQLAQELLRVDVFSPEVCKSIVEYVETLPETRWYFRGKINSLPTTQGVKASYWFLGDKQQPKELSDYLFKIAPRIDGQAPVEACINRYHVGDYMPEHIDIALFRHNMVVQLTDTGDGLLLGDEFVKDVPGKATIFPANSGPHSVPPVKALRYILIYLYE